MVARASRPLNSASRRISSPDFVLRSSLVGRSGSALATVSGETPETTGQRPVPPSKRISLGVIILAAGQSKRMGKPKLFLPWRNTTILGHLLERWQKLNSKQIAVVCATNDAAVQAELDRQNFPQDQRVINPKPERGMFSSIQCAARWPGWKLELTHWIITLGDQPQIREETLRALLDFARANENKICQPRRNGHGRHPVVLPKFVFDALKNSSAENLKQFLQKYSADSTGFESDDAGLDVDLDTQDDYQRAVETFSSPSQ